MLVEKNKVTSNLTELRTKLIHCIKPPFLLIARMQWVPAILLNIAHSKPNESEPVVRINEKCCYFKHISNSTFNIQRKAAEYRGPLKDNLTSQPACRGSCGLIYWRCRRNRKGRQRRLVYGNIILIVGARLRLQPVSELAFSK